MYADVKQKIIVIVFINHLESNMMFNQNPYFNLKQLITDFYECKLSDEEFDSPDFFINAAKEAIELVNTTAIKSIDHEFNPKGYTLIMILADSSLTIHTWPEERFITTDFFTCSEKSDPSNATDYFISKFKAKTHKIYEIAR